MAHRYPPPAPDTANTGRRRKYVPLVEQDKYVSKRWKAALVGAGLAFGSIGEAVVLWLAR